MKRREDDNHANHERWLVSYADFITLMFAFFVVMFASSHADREKVQQISEAVAKALEHGKISERVMQMLGAPSESRPAPRPSVQPSPLAAKLPELTPAMQQLTAELQNE